MITYTYVIFENELLCSNLFSTVVIILWLNYFVVIGAEG